MLSILKVDYINDSKATNVNATYALESMTRPTIWIVGGVDKGNDYTKLLPLVRKNVKAIICLGLNNETIIDCFSPVVNLLIEAGSMFEAVQSYDLAKKVQCYCRLLVQALTFLRTMKIAEINLNNLFVNFNLCDSFAYSWR